MGIKMKSHFNFLSRADRIAVRIVRRSESPFGDDRYGFLREAVFQILHDMNIARAAFGRDDDR